MEFRSGPEDAGRCVSLRGTPPTVGVVTQRSRVRFRLFPPSRNRYAANYRSLQRVLQTHTKFCDETSSISTPTPQNYEVVSGSDTEGVKLEPETLGRTATSEDGNFF